MSALEGRVAIVTGASRGIGRALALGLAKAGCHVVIAAKSTTSTEKLPGSIFSVAKEVEALGVQALPVQVDVRDEQQIENLAAKTLERFGRIDLLLNNAGGNVSPCVKKYRALAFRETGAQKGGMTSSVAAQWQWRT
ncbi:MAG TPA: SDR family NAD(P)-dependent oxidoreductase [Gemmataceae bacterium]|jgi:citronellol/citronellal dehydrogenase